MQFEQSYARAELTGNSGLQGISCAEVGIANGSAHIYLFNLDNETVVNIFLPKDLQRGQEYPVDTQTRVTTTMGVDFAKGWDESRKLRKYDFLPDPIDSPGTIAVSGAGTVKVLKFPDDRRDEYDYNKDGNARSRAFHYQINMKFEATDGQKFDVAGDVIFPHPDYHTNN